LVCKMLSIFYQADDGIRDRNVTGVQTCALPIYILDTAVFHVCFKVAGLDICKDVKLLDFGKDFRGSLGGNLAAVSTVDLIAVVLDRKSVVVGKECRSRW